MDSNPFVRPRHISISVRPIHNFLSCGRTTVEYIGNMMKSSSRYLFLDFVIIHCRFIATYKFEIWMWCLQDALAAFKSDYLTPPSALPPFETVKDIVDFINYFAEESHYSTSSAPPSYIRPSGS